MAIYVVNHKVENFDEWKKAYDAFQPAATEAGIKDLHVLTSLTDRNHVVVIGEGADDDVQRFMSSDALRSAMEGAGVAGQPDIFIGSSQA